MTELPEYASIEDFIEFLMDEDRAQYDHRELQALSYNIRLSASKVRKELDSWGLTLQERPKERRVRGINSWDNNRWAGNPCGGGSGWEQIAGFSGQRG